MTIFISVRPALKCYKTAGYDGSEVQGKISTQELHRECKRHDSCKPWACWHHHHHHFLCLFILNVLAADKAAVCGTQIIRNAKNFQKCLLTAYISYMAVLRHVSPNTQPNVSNSAHTYNTVHAEPET